ncbi:uncharacterized protein LOC143109685 [Alosa pseudoharengus]|uniref:uncharacterized protein LOC143109685 n=1 Tax=Alosa pseudoharengus TaxID=34774 RepID=UPI003F8A9CEC
METSSLAAERVKLAETGLSGAVVKTIQSARAFSTRALYTLKRRIFDQWCSARGHDPFQCSVIVILNFLQELLDQGKAASTIKVYVAAISACHFGIGGASPGTHPWVTRFMAGVRRFKVSRPVLFPTWDLTVVLRALTEPPFEPLQSVDTKTLSLKTALLVALASAKRVSEIHALSVHPSCLRFSAGGEKVVLCPNTSFIPKVITAPLQSQVIELASFSPPPFASVEEETLHKLCPVRALRLYLDRTKEFRCCDQLFVCHGSASRGKALSKSRLAHWIVEAIEMAYRSLKLEPPVGLRAHSTRGVSSSWALYKGVSVDDICRAAGWTSIHTFARFYMLDVTKSSVSQAVLGSFIEVVGEGYGLSKTSVRRVLGLVDSTLIPIANPSVIDQAYILQKGYAAINVQVIVDHRGVISDLVARWPSSTHNSFVWANSAVGEQAEREGFSQSLFLGHSGYPLRTYLFTPLSNPQTRAERTYNVAHVRTRNVVERAVGIWKLRFRCLHKSAGGLRMKPHSSCAVTVATAILHNMAVRGGAPIPEKEKVESDEEEDGEVEVEVLYPPQRAALHAAGVEARQLLIANVFG